MVNVPWSSLTLTATHRSAVLSTSAAFRSPLADGVPTTALFSPPASVTIPALVPVITAASLAAVMVMVITCSVPPEVVTVNRSVTVPAFKACTAVAALFSV